MPMNSVADALGRFTEILGTEVTRLEAEEDKQRQKIATQRITEAFGKISPLHDEEDVRRIMLETVSDASALETLDSQLPLITSLYNDTMQSITRYKAKKQDELIGKYAEDVGFEGPAGLTGANKFELLKYEDSREVQVESTNQKGQTELVIYSGISGQVKQRFSKDMRTDEDKMKLDLKKIWETARANSYYRDPADYISYAGTTTTGLPVTLNKQTGLFYVPYTDPKTGAVSMRPLGSDDKVVRGSTTNQALTDAVKERKFWEDETQRIFTVNEQNAFDILNRMGISLPIDASGKNVATSNFGKLYNMTDKEFMQSLSKAGYIDIDDKGNITKIKNPEAYNTIKDKYNNIKEQFSIYTAANQQANATANLLTYEQVLDTYQMTPQEYNQYYDSARSIVGSSDPKYTDVSNFIKLTLIESLGLKGFTDSKGQIIPNKLNEVSGTQWQVYWDQLGNIGYGNKKGKGYVMSELRNARVTPK